MGSLTSFLAVIRSRRVVGALAFGVVLVLVLGLEIVAQPHQYFAHWRPGVYLNAKLAALLLAVVSLVVIASLLRVSWPIVVLKPLPCAALLISAWQLRAIAPYGALCVGLLALPLAGLALLPNARASRVWLLGVLFSGAVMRLWLFQAHPLTNTGGDMVPLLAMASKRLLSGQSPYAVYSMPWQLPLTYLPGSFLPCVPFFALGLDLRWSFVAGHLIAALALVWPLWRKRVVLSDQPAIVMWLLYFVAPATLRFDALSNSALAWTALLLTVLACARWPNAWGWVLGVALVTTPLTLPLAMVLLAHQARVQSSKALAVQLAKALLVVALALAPWLIWDHRSFVFGVFSWFNDLNGFAAQKWEAGRTWARFVGFAGLFWSLGCEPWLRVLQALGAAGLSALTCRYAPQGPNVIAPFAMAALAWFLMWNPVVWPYLPHGLLPLLALCLGVPGIGAPSATR